MREVIYARLLFVDDEAALMNAPCNILEDARAASSSTDVTPWRSLNGHNQSVVDFPLRISLAPRRPR